MPEPGAKFFCIIPTNRFTFPAIVGGLIEQVRVGGVSVKILKANEVWLNSIKLRVWLYGKKNSVTCQIRATGSTPLKKAVAVATSGEICVYFSMWENRERTK